MALYRLEAKIFSREKRGRSVVAAAAYRAGTRLLDEVKDKIYDYRRRQAGIIETTILTPAGTPDWVHDPAKLWNTVERGEKRKDAQLAREFILAVPPELSAKEQFETAKKWAQEELVASGMVAEISLHHTKTGNNPHVHILCTMRKLDGDKFSSKKALEWNNVELLIKQRESWSEAVNASLEKAGRPERVDHRSLQERGIDRLPEPKIGVKATAMKRRGVEADPKRFQFLRQIKLLNDVRPMWKAMKQAGEVKQEGVGKTWWEKSRAAFARVRDKTKEKVVGAWTRFLDKQEQKPPPSEPQRDR
jgi:ATP-dependent exoDNAse (exonuclease V) alpha subunit